MKKNLRSLHSETIKCHIVKLKLLGKLTSIIRIHQMRSAWEQDLQHKMNEEEATEQEESRTLKVFEGDKSSYEGHKQKLNLN